MGDNEDESLKVLKQEIAESKAFSNDRNERARWLADALSFNAEKCARFLIQEHAALDSCKEQFSVVQPAIMVAKTGNLELLQFLFDNGVAPDQHDAKHETALSHAVDLKNEELCRVCLKNGASPEGSVKCGVTPLQKAIFGDEPMIALALLEHNANPLSCGLSAQTAMKSAMKKTGNVWQEVVAKMRETEWYKTEKARREQAKAELAKRGQDSYVKPPTTVKAPTKKIKADRINRLSVVARYHSAPKISFGARFNTKVNQLSNTPGPGAYSVCFPNDFN